ncbi:MAG: RnfABCDGE type electron transport complex subunit G [Clostridiales bacterium]|nr:RnfABCDGE type electron transport complex subunit G [Clostridiales bacterium]
MSETWTLGLKLFIITAVAALALGVTNYMTDKVIADRADEGEIELMQGILSDAENFEEIEVNENSKNNAKVIEIFKGVGDSDQVVGHILKVMSKGYGGDMEVIVGIDTDGRIGTVEIGKHGETPGLGDKITNEEFLDQFKDKVVSEPLDGIEAITGATVSTDAVNNAVDCAMEYFNENVER